MRRRGRDQVEARARCASPVEEGAHGTRWDTAPTAAATGDGDQTEARAPHAGPVEEGARNTGGRDQIEARARYAGPV